MEVCERAVSQRSTKNDGAEDASEHSRVLSPYGPDQQDSAQDGEKREADSRCPRSADARADVDRDELAVRTRGTHGDPIVPADATEDPGELN